MDENNILIPGGSIGEPAETGSVYDSYQRMKAEGSIIAGYGRQPLDSSSRPDVDPLGVSSTRIAESGASPISSDTVTGLRLVDGSWMNRDELVQSDYGRRLVAAEERIRRGQKKNFIDGIFSGSWTDLVPFMGMFASVGGSPLAAADVNRALGKMINDEPLTPDEAVKVSLYKSENELNAQGSWGYTFGSIVRQAPAFFAEFGVLGKVGQAVRSGIVKGIVKEGTDEAAKKASTWALTGAVKTGFDEYAEALVKQAASAEMSATGKSFAEAVRALGSNQAVRADTLDSLAKLGKQLVSGAANSAAKPDTWASGLVDKVARVRGAAALDSAISRLSTDSVVAKSWNGLRRATAKAFSEGLMDLGTFGSDAATTITTGESRAGRAALDAVMQLTVGAASRGSLMFLPKETLNVALGKTTGMVGQQELALKSAAVQNQDRDLYEKAGWMGMFMDLMEYVSESTGRGFNSAGRAIGLAVAPKLFAPARKTAGLVHPVKATISRDAAGKAAGVRYEGLFEAGNQTEVGGVIRRYLETRFGGTKLKENVAADKMLAVRHALSEAGVAVDNPAALQATIDSGVIQAGVSQEIADVIGSDVGKFVSRSVKAANKARIDGLKIHGTQLYYLANYLAEHNIDALAAADKFRQMGYDGVVSEMFEERYSDVVNAIFGMNAHKDQSFRTKMTRAWRAAFGRDEETGEWRLGDLLAEAAAFSVPLVARATIMRGIAAMGGPNDFQREKNWAALWHDGTRYASVGQYRLGDYLLNVNAQQSRLVAEADKARKSYDDEIEARSAEPADGQPPRVAATEAQMREYLATEERYRKAATRLGSLRDAYVASIVPGTKENDTVVAPLYEDSYLLSSDEVYNLRLHPTEGQLVKSMGAYATLVNDAAKSWQTCYKLQNRTKEESPDWFRKASHRIVSGALRLTGTVVTGDMSFMSVNPAQWANADRSLPDDVTDAGVKLYGRLFEEELKAETDRRSAAVANGEDVENASMASYDVAHERALEKMQPLARELMARLIAAHQTRMFSEQETRDVALGEIAREYGYDPATDGRREFVSRSDGTRVSFDEFAARSAVAEKLDGLSRDISTDIYTALTRGMGADRSLIASREDGTRAVDSILTIPSDLPTARQATLARVMRRIPGLRDAELAHVVQKDKSIDDQLGGIATDSDLLGAVTTKIFPDGLATLDSNFDFASAAKRIEEADEAMVTRLALDLNIPCDGTRRGIEERNVAIARIAAASYVAADPGLRTYSRMSTDAERDSRLGNPFGVFTTARMQPDGSWVTSLRDANGNLFSAADAATLDAAMRNAGYAPANPKVVFTSARVLESDDAVTMIKALNLGGIYRERLETSGMGDKYVDPLIRMDSSDEETADSTREVERTLSDLFEAKGKQGDPSAAHLFLRDGEKATDSAAMKRAVALQAAAKDAWEARNDRTSDGKALGYVAIAEDLLAEYGVSVPFSSRGNAFGIASQGFRGKYVINIRALRSIGATGNVYVPIMHRNAQSYEAALLDGALFTSYARNAQYIRRVFPGLISQFVDDLDAVAETVQLDAASNNPKLADDIAAFRRFACQRNADQVRIPGPSAFAAIVSAFNLYRTETDNAHLMSELGPHAAALVALAPHARKLTSFIGFTAAVDRILGGAGFETSILTGKEVPASGLARYWSVFAPRNAGTMAAAIAGSRPGKCADFNEFVERATAGAQAAGRPRPFEGRVTSALEVAQQVAVENNLEPEEVVPFIAERLGEVRATISGGNVEDVATPVEPAESIDGIRLGDDADDEFTVIDDQWAMNGPAVVATASAPAVQDANELRPSEAKSLVRTFAAMATVATGSVPNPLTFKDILRRLAPGLKKSDVDSLGKLYSALRKDEGFVSDFSWGEDEDDEGVAPDGTERSNQRSVDMLKRKALSDFLAMMNIVSPSTGRDFQPFVEDLRSIAAAQPFLNADAGDDVKEAFGFLSKIMNPRSEDCPDGAAGRDAIWRHRMDAFENDRKTISKYIRAFLGEHGKPPVSGRAALLLAYLASVPKNARVNLAMLIGSSSPSSPVRLDRSAVGGNVVFQVSPYRRSGGHASMDTITGSFSRLADLSEEDAKDSVSAIEKGFLDSLKSGGLTPSRGHGLLRNARTGATGIFDEYAKVLGPVLGWDSPLVSMFVSQPMASMLGGDYVDAYARGQHLRTAYHRLQSKFGTTAEGQLPSAAKALIDVVKTLVASGKTGRDGFVRAAIGMFQAGSPAERNVTRAATSLQGASAWADLMRAYADAKPVSVMTAMTDPERTSSPASSLAITMCGIEPALQEFLDRKDENGFEAVLRKWFPKRFEGLDDAQAAERLGQYRQRMIWPTSRADLIVAKSISKSAYATETIAGCKTAYELETMSESDFANAVSKYGSAAAAFVRRNMVYVPVYSGDHASSILLQVPLAKEFKAAGMDYDAAAQLVSSWVGLDLLGTDAKRSAVTCLEAPGTAMWDYRYDENGEILREGEGEDATPVRGHAYVSIVWNSDKSADNEAMIGTTGLVGYGARRQKEIAGDPSSNTLKVHIAATGEDAVYGPTLSLIKSLAVAMPNPEERYTFVNGSPMSFLQEHACRLIKGEEDISSVTYTDFDSIKLGVANSKTVFAGYDADNKPVALMNYVFSKLAAKLESAPDEVGSTISGAQLDELVGEIDWTNLGNIENGKVKPVVAKKLLSELLNGAQIREIRRDGEHKGRMFSLDYLADNQMAFQVANVSHKAKSEYKRTPRNNMLDAFAMARNLVTYNADPAIFRGAKAVADEVRDTISSWGFVGAAIATDRRSIENQLAEDEGYQDLLNRGASEDGDLAREYRMRVFAANARKSFVNVPIHCIQAPLTTNAGWVGKDGRGYSHSASQMFNDTLQGARTIAGSDRQFMRGVKYAAIANVNCVDPTFRHGLYVSKDALLTVFSSVVDSVQEVKSQPAGSYRQVVALLDHVITQIVVNESGRKGFYTPVANEASWREKLAGCLLDHHGQPLSLRQRTLEKTQRDDDGNVIRDDNGAPAKVREVRYNWQDISFADLFTASTSEGASEMEFDRTAVYPSMHLDADNQDHIYLGGTLMGIPRTPSYNGSMWLQNARAGLPVTERFDENSQQWECGRDAMVSPDPFTLKILGCDHDGDKTTIYMLTNGGFASMSELTDGVDELISELGLDGEFTATDSAGRAKLTAYLERLSKKGYVEYEAVRDSAGKVTGVKGLRLSKAGQAKISNLFVQGLFDMNRMLPVGTEQGDVAVYSGPVRDGEHNVGSMFGATKAAIGPKSKEAILPNSAWDEAIKAQDVMARKVLDAERGAIIGRPDVAAEVQTGAAQAADARAVIVALASSLHYAYASGLPVGPFATRRDVTPSQWVDFMYHVDGLSNMTFDDIKEQICSRLGVKPGMIETIICDLINSGEGGRLPTTDREFIAAFCKYAKDANDENGSRHWMGRASDPSDFEFRRTFGEFLPKAGEELGAILREYSASKAGDDTALYWSGELGENFDRTSTRIKMPFNGFAYWLCRVCPQSKRNAAIDDIVKWYVTMESLRDARDFASAVNYTAADPAANNASARAMDSSSNYISLMKRLDEEAENGVRHDAKSLAAVRRMRAGVALLYDRSVGEVVAAKGIRAARDFRANRAAFLERYANSAAVPGRTSREALLATSLYAVPTVASSDAMALQANAQSVGWSIAAFNTVPQLPGSQINAGNAYEVLERIGRTLAGIRHPKSGGTNVSLDVRYGIEAMADLVARFAVNSTMHDELPIFDYLREVPDANARHYTERDYGPAARGLSRIVLSMSGVSEAQITEAQGLYARVVSGRELDSNGRLGSKGYKSTTGYSPKYALSLALNVANLKAMKKFVASQDPRSSAKVDDRSAAQGSARDVAKTIDELLVVFADLEKQFGAGFTIQPSALFGQILPLYAAITDRVESAPEAGTSSLLALFGGHYTRWEYELAKINKSSNEPLVSAAIAVNWAPVLAAIDEQDDPEALRVVGEEKKVRARRLKPARFAASGVLSAEDQLHEIAKEGGLAFAKAARKAMVYGKIPVVQNGKLVRGTVDFDTFRSDEARDPNFRHTLSIFDGARGVLYRQLLAATRGQLAESFANPRKTGVAPAKRAAEVPAPAVTPAKPAVIATKALVETKKPAPIATEGRDERVAAIADRMGAVLKMWDKGRVEYDGGNKFSIYGTFHANGSFDARIDVEVKDGASLLSDEEILGKISSKDKAYLASLANRLGKTAEELGAMDTASVFKLALANRPVGRSVREHSGDLPGEFRLSADMLGKLTGRIEIAKDAEAGVAYHEIFHSVMGFMRTLGAFSADDVKVLNKKYGDHATLGKAWFDEEKAADEFRAFVEGTVNPDAGRDGVFQRIVDFLSELVDLLFGGGAVTSDLYANQMDENPLAQIVLTGHAFTSDGAVENLDLHGKIARATATYFKSKGIDFQTGHSNIAPGFSVNDMTEDEINSPDARFELTREWAMLSDYFGPDAVDDVVYFGEFLAGLERIADQYAAYKGTVDNPKSQKDQAIADLVFENSGPRSSYYGQAYAQFMRKYGPTPVKAAVAPEAVEPAEVRPNETYESDISDFIKGVQVVEGRPEDFDGPSYGLSEEDAYDVEPVHGEIRARLRSIGVDRMARPYAKMNVLAREVGRAVRLGTAPATDSVVTEARARRVAFEQHAVVSDALRQVASVYGVDITSDEKERNLLFRTMHEIYGMVGPDAAQPLRISGGTTRETASHVSRSVLAAAVTTASGVRVSDVAEATLEDLASVSRRYGETSTFRLNVLNPLRAAFENLAKADPSKLVDDEEYRDRMVWDAVESIEAGLVRGDVRTDGSFGPFRLAEEGSSSRRDFDRNRLRYADHIENPDFQTAVRTALDRLYMVGASMRFYRQLGFEPGTPESYLSVRGNIAPANMPEPLSPSSAMSAFNAAPEQLADADTDIVDFFDQPAFSANHPEAWLDSMVRDNFGGVSFREAMQNGNRAVAGFHHRANMLSNLQDRLLGLDIQPGQALTAIDRGYGTKFAMEGGRTVRRDGGSALKFDAYRGKKAIDASTGKTVIYDLTDVRRTDMFLKALRVWAAGGRSIVTGVDEVAFSLNDPTDPEHYSWDEVQKRADDKEVQKRAGDTANGYSLFDKALVRLHRQLSDDKREPWSDIVGPDGLDLYGRLVRAACQALSNAKTLNSMNDRYGRPVLEAGAVNDYVIRSLERQGLLVGHEKFIPGIRRNGYVSAAVTIPVDEFDSFYRGSSTYRKLIDAGRLDSELTREALAKPLLDLWREVREFVDSNPFLSDGDGAFFHNVNTPVPFVQGDGYFMYAANRRARKDRLESAAEALNVYETAFKELCEDENGAGNRASAANDSAILLLRVLFPEVGNVESAQAVRDAIADGKYDEFGIGAESTQRDLALAVYRRLAGMVWRKAGDPVVKRLGGEASVGRMRRFFENYRGATDSVVTGANGMTDEMAFRQFGVLPHSDQLGHSVQRAIDGIGNAYAFRASLFSMLTAPSADGSPVCYAKPAEDAVDAGGLTDQLWGAVARWWAETNGLKYDVAETGVRNASRIYDEIMTTMKDGKISGRPFGTLSKEDIDVPSITSVTACTEVPEGESAISGIASGYALGYAKHLMQSTRALGRAWQRKCIHRAYSYSKSLSVSFSYFFPLATRFESPVGAIGALATLGGNLPGGPDAIRKHADALKKVFRGNAWVTKDFLGQRDVFEMLDSNDPYLSELYHWAGCLGIGISDASVNPLDHSRGVMQEDLKKVVALARRTGGTKVAARVDSILKAVLTKGGDRAFTYHLNATKLAVTAQLCQRLQYEAAVNGIAFDPVRDLKRYSGYINAEVGGIDPLKYAWAHPAARNWLNSLFFSWEWTRGAWEAGGGPILEQVLFGGHDMTREERHHMAGRWTRMFLEVMIGVPMLFQVLSKALGTALIAGLDPDDPEVDEEERERLRRLVEMVRKGSWSTWGNESKIGFTGYDVTPLMAGIAARFPRFARYADDHPLLYAAPTLAAAMAGKPWLMLGTLPVYTGRDSANVTGGRRYYQRYGKQGWEFFRWFESPFKQFLSKMPMPVQRIAEGLFGRSLTYMDHPQPYNDMGDIERWISPTADSAWFNIARAFVPFSVTSLLDTGDAGALSVLGPVSMGAAKGSLTKQVAAEILRWSRNDRRGYAFGGESVHAPGQFKYFAALRIPGVAKLIREARDNGVSEKESYAIVDNALRELTGSVYDRLVALAPKDPGDDFDTAEMARTLRQANRLGMLSEQLYETLVERLEKQNRWADVRREERLKIIEILRQGKLDPYGFSSETVNEGVKRYDY